MKIIIPLDELDIKLRIKGKDKFGRDDVTSLFWYHKLSGYKRSECEAVVVFAKVYFIAIYFYKYLIIKQF